MTPNPSPELQARLRAYRSITRDLERVIRGDAPTETDLSNAPLLDMWRFAFSQDLCLVGQVTDHPLIEPGPATTSALFFLDPEGKWARTYTRWYKLGRRLEDMRLL
jgi:hypothetical protein